MVGHSWDEWRMAGVEGANFGLSRVVENPEHEGYKRAP